MEPYASHENMNIHTVFRTKRTIFITRFSGITNKHFYHEKPRDWSNMAHNDWTQNPFMRLKRSECRVGSTVDRIFYYSGDDIKV